MQLYNLSLKFSALYHTYFLSQSLVSINYITDYLNREKVKKIHLD